MPTTDEDLARARLAYISAGQRPLSAPRRAEPADEEAADAPTGSAELAGDGQGTRPQLRWRDVAQSLGGFAWMQDPALRRRYVAAVLVLLLVGVGITVVVLGRSQASQVDIAEPPVQVQVSTPTPDSTPEPEVVRIRVHVLGAVVYPGVVTLDEGSIVADAVAAAGGLAVDADPAELNLAAHLLDGQQIIVGTLDEPRGDVRDQPGSPPDDGGAGGGGLVNLNTATATGLEALPGVGPVLAAAIITWRDGNGGFRSVTDLQEVPGIGPKTFATLEPLVTV